MYRFNYQFSCLHGIPDNKQYINQAKMKANQNNYTQIATVVASIFILMLLGYTAFRVLDTDQDLPPVVSFAFDTYCPIDSAQSLAIVNKQLDSQGISPLNFNYGINRNVYVVNVQSRHSDPNNPNSSVLLYYCGYAKQWSEANCNNARFICSIPGPMFYFPVRQQATIIWINGIDFTGLNYTKERCYDDETSTDMDCTVSAKPKNWENCTYFSPTDYQYTAKDIYRIVADSVPISPHIHGLEVRPVFDGNPLGWFTANQRGSGFQTMYNEKYFNQFINVDVFAGKNAWADDLKRRSKVILVENNQAPGMLFYHDHAMKSTLYNVQYGLGGLYIIYDPVAQSTLPQGKYQKCIVFSKQGDARTNLVHVSPDHSQFGDELLFERSATYRFRVLNAAFDNVFNNVVFAAFYTVEKVNGKFINKQIDPTNKEYNLDLDNNKHLIPFTVIGTDTSLFNNPVNNVTYLNFGPAERVVLLIRFDTELPSNINNVYFVCNDQNQGKTVIKYQFKIQPTPQTLFQKITQVFPNKNNVLTVSDGYIPDQRLKFPQDYLGIQVPYTNLSKIAESQIAVKRHRPLFSLPYDMRFMIGAHYMFEEGFSDQPQIGTFEDFYMINNLWEDHPMHIHLVNHQAIKAYSLKQLPENPNCTLYFLDYFRLSGLAQFIGLDNLQLCNYLWDLEDDEVISLFHSMKSYMPESEIIKTENGNVSGLDVMATSKGDKAYSVGGCSFDLTHKYICEETSNEILEHQRRWKDTTMVHKYSVFVLRVRWASTLYNPSITSYPYFNIPQEHLVQFPGFVYHCHILPHEDNQMMRGFNMQYSEYYKKSVLPYEKRLCANTNWHDQMICINNNLGCKLTA